MKGKIKMKEKNLPGAVLIPIGVSLLAAVIIAVALLLAFTGIAYATEDPDSLVRPLSLAALALSTLICGAVSSRLCDSEILSPVLSSAISGVGMALLLFLLSVIPVGSGAEYSMGFKAVMYLAVIAICTIGGVIGRSRGRRRPKYPRKIKRR